MQKGAVGIDLGNNFIRAAVCSCSDGFHNTISLIPNLKNNLRTPTVLALVKQDSGAVTWVIGEDALLVPREFQIYHFKYLLGKRLYELSENEVEQTSHLKLMDKDNKLFINVPIYKGDQDAHKPVTPQELVQQLCKHLFQFVSNFLVASNSNASIKCVATVPGFFNDAQRYATKTALNDAQLNCLRLINEPTAIVLASGVPMDNQNLLKCLIVDSKAHSTTITYETIDDGIFEVIEVYELKLGGEDFTIKLAKHVENQFKNEYAHLQDIVKINPVQLHAACEQVKYKLCSSKLVEVNIDNCLSNCDQQVTLLLQQENFEKECVSEFFDKIVSTFENILKKNNFKSSELDYLVVAGGSAHIPMVKRATRQLFTSPTTKVMEHPNPDESTVRGAAIQACILTGF